MPERTKKPESPAQKKSVQAPKKPYEPPNVVSHHQMEVIAGTCAEPGKQDILGPPACTFSNS